LLEPLEGYANIQDFVSVLRRAHDQI